MEVDLCYPKVSIVAGPKSLLSALLWLITNNILEPRKFTIHDSQVIVRIQYVRMSSCNVCMHRNCEVTMGKSMGACDPYITQNHSWWL